MSTKPETLNDLVMDSLKKNYFALALVEHYPRTPAVTEKLDKLEAAIRGMTNQQQAKETP